MLLQSGPDSETCDEFDQNNLEQNCILEIKRATLQSVSNHFFKQNNKFQTVDAYRHLKKHLIQFITPTLITLQSF